MQYTRSYGSTLFQNFESCVLVSTGKTRESHFAKTFIEARNSDQNRREIYGDLGAAGWRKCVLEEEGVRVVDCSRLAKDRVQSELL